MDIKKLNLFDKKSPLTSPFSKARQNYSEKFFVADGEKTVLRLLNSNLEVSGILCLKKFYDKYKDLFCKKGLSKKQILIAEKPEMEKIVGYSVHQGFMALARRPEYLSLEEISYPAVFLNKVRDAENVGSIVRTCLAFGINNLIFDHGSCSPYIRRAVRVSMGYIFRMRVSFQENNPEALEYFRGNGIAVIGTSARNEINLTSQSIYDIDFPSRYILVLGNEGEGLAKEIFSQCTHLLHVPMANGVSSLNITNALAAILLKACEKK